MRPQQLLAALALAAAVAASRADAQVGPPRTQQFPFGVGAGGFAVTDTGNVSDTSAFSNAGWWGFGEVVLEPGVLLQLRYQSFLLPGTPVTPPFGVGGSTKAPDVRVRAGIASVGYLFRESWWDGGFVAGVGVYGIDPKAPGPDESSADVRETVVGWHGGLVAAFHVATRWDLRIEAIGYLLRTDQNHKPITLGASVGYHF